MRDSCASFSTRSLGPLSGFTSFYPTYQLSIKTFRKKEGKIPSLEEQEESYIKWVLSEVGGNKTLAAQILGIDRVSLWRKLQKYGLEGEEGLIGQ